MRKFAVYALIVVAEVIRSVVCICLLGQFRKNPPVFFEICIAWPILSGLIIRWAKSFAENPPTFGQFQSNIESWQRLQRSMREEENERRRYRN